MQGTDAYFSVDIETDGPIPGRYSMLSFGIVYAGEFDGKRFCEPSRLDRTFYRELRPISEEFQTEALAVNGLDRDHLCRVGLEPALAMREAATWIAQVSAGRKPVLVAYPLAFDWSWMYWYFINFTGSSPFAHSRGFDIKTAFAVKAKIPVVEAGHSHLANELRPRRPMTHHALDDALAQAEIFIKMFGWSGE